MITASLNPSFISTKLDFALSKEIVVAKDGSGNYDSIYAAVNAGHRNIFVKEGIYDETADIVLNNQSLIGASKENTVIALSDSTIELKSFSASDVYSTGKVSITSGTKYILGSGTSFTSTPISFIDPYIIFNGAILQVSKIIDDSTIELSYAYVGSSVAKVDFILYDLFSIGSSFSGFTVNHAPTAPRKCLSITGFMSTVKENIFILNEFNTSYGVYVAKGSFQSRVENNSFTSGKVQLCAIDSFFTSFIGNSLTSASVTSIYLSSSSASLYSARSIIKSNSISSAGSFGIEIASHNCLVSDNRVSNSPDSIYIHDSSLISLLRNSVYSISCSSVTACILSSNSVLGSVAVIDSDSIILNSNIISLGVIFGSTPFSIISKNTVSASTISLTGGTAAACAIIDSNSVTPPNASNPAVYTESSLVIVSNNNLKNSGIKTTLSTSRTSIISNSIRSLARGIVDDSGASIIASNLIATYAISGISVTSSCSPDTIITRNSISGDVAPAPYGILLGSSKITVSHNTISFSTAGSGVSIDTFSINSFIIRSNLILNSLYGVRRLGGSTDYFSIISSNVIQSLIAGVHISAGLGFICFSNIVKTDSLCSIYFHMLATGYSLIIANAVMSSIITPLITTKEEHNISFDIMLISETVPTVSEAIVVSQTNSLSIAESIAAISEAASVSQSNLLSSSETIDSLSEATDA